MADANPLTLKGKIAVITGAGRGIGRAIALGYGKAGAQVVCLARTLTEIQSAAAEIRSVGGQALAIPADVTDPEMLAGVFGKIREEFGRIDILVLNAGAHLERKSVEESDPQKWRATIELNLFGPYFCVRAALPAMKHQGGKIILLGSGRGRRSVANTSAYSCSKAAVWMFTRILAEECMPYRISVNELIPGPVVTEAFKETLADVDPRKVFPEGEWFKQPEDVLPLALFMATQPENGPTGQVFSLMRRDAL
jgi:3-oxoacyl-[acyl-carrier protein] reductase